MVHWLEEAEKGNVKKKADGSSSSGFLDRKLNIEKNYEVHGKEYDAFIQKLDQLAKRVNALPLQQKDPFGNIDSQEKESKLPNHKHVMKSSVRFQKKIFRGSFWDFIKPKHLKHVRVLEITVSSQFGKVGFDVRDESLLKEKVVVDKELVKERKRYVDKNRFHEYLNWEIRNLDEELALTIIDWLAFKIEASDLPFVK